MRVVALHWARLLLGHVTVQPLTGKPNHLGRLHISSNVQRKRFMFEKANTTDVDRHYQQVQLSFLQFLYLLFSRIIAQSAHHERNLRQGNFLRNISYLHHFHSLTTRTPDDSDECHHCRSHFHNMHTFTE